MPLDPFLAAKLHPLDGGDAASLDAAAAARWAEYDDLRPSAELPARQLSEAGVRVEATPALGMLHGGLNGTPTLDKVDSSLDVFAAALRE